MNENVVKQRIEQVMDDYQFPIDKVILSIYENYPKDMLFILAVFHANLNGLFQFMNAKSRTNMHYNADPSRDLLKTIEDLYKVKELHSKIGISISIDPYYEGQMAYVKTFLEESYGSTIPADYNEIKIEDINPIFTLPTMQNVELGKPERITREFARNQLSKLDSRIAINDFDGVVTTCRALLEDVLKSIYEDETGKQLKGDFNKMWSIFSKEFNLHVDPAVKGKFDSILNGITSIISGIAVIRNLASNSHSPGRYKPLSKHHARFLRNLTITLVDFLFETVEFQKRNKK